VVAENTKFLTTSACNIAPSKTEKYPISTAVSLYKIGIVKSVNIELPFVPPVTT
jgi:hypothetical protein